MSHIYTYTNTYYVNGRVCNTLKWPVLWSLLYMYSLYRPKSQPSQVYVRCQLYVQDRYRLSVRL